MDSRLSVYEQKLLEYRNLGLIPDTLVAPLFVLWDLTFACNHNCLHCFNNSGHETAALSEDQVFKLCDELAAACVHSVCLSGGEAILSPFYFEVIRRLSEGGVLVSTITNGFAWEDETAYRLVQLGIENVQVSIDSTSPEIHDRLHGVKGAHRKALLAAASVAHEGINLDIAFTPTKMNLQEYGATIELAAELGARNFRSMPMMPTGRGFLNRACLALSREDEEEIYRIVKEKSVKYRNRMDISYASPIHHYTYFGKIPVFFIEILPNGDLRLSPYMNLLCGNVAQTGFNAAWQEGAASSWSHPVVLERIALIHEVRDFAEQMPPAWIAEDLRLDLGELKGAVLCRIPQGEM